MVWILLFLCLDFLDYFKTWGHPDKKAFFFIVLILFCGFGLFYRMFFSSVKKYLGEMGKTTDL
jgi:hypothetical protein